MAAPGNDGRNDVAVRLVAGGAAILATSVLTDSGMEHYRGSFRDPAMVLPLGASAMSIAFSARRSAEPEAADSRWAPRSDIASAAIGMIGLGFHAYNVGKRVGGFGFTNLFYAAPIGAPGALVLTGALGRIANALADGTGRVGPVPVGSGRVLGGVAAFGILGSAAEAALLHFRGAYHDPFMWAPVTIPPLAALLLARDVIADDPRRTTTVLLGATAALGLVGVGFHAWGVQRNMGGWRNWRQNVLAGPPIPAPPAFTGLAIAALGAVLLMKRRHAA